MLYSFMVNLLYSWVRYKQNNKWVYSTYTKILNLLNTANFIRQVNFLSVRRSKAFDVLKELRWRRSEDSGRNTLSWLIANLKKTNCKSSQDSHWSRHWEKSPRVFPGQFRWLKLRVLPATRSEKWKVERAGEKNPKSSGQAKLN